MKGCVTTDDITNKPRNSVYPMISVDEALGIILKNTQIEEVEEVYYLDSLNRICACDIIAEQPLPPFAASIKDGFAVRLTTEQKNYKLLEDSSKINFVFDVIGVANAGDQLMNIDLKEGQCVKINTGAPVPFKADAVVQIEDTISLEKNSTGNDTKIQIVSSSVGCSGKKLEKIEIPIGQDIRPIGFF